MPASVSPRVETALAVTALQAARALVSAQIVFNLLVIGLAVGAVRAIGRPGPPSP